MRARPVVAVLAVFMTAVLGMIGLLLGSAPALAALVPDVSPGAGLFEQHCVGCHVHGGNIIRRGKTLRRAALERNGINGPERIAAIAAGGQGQMSAYGAVLGEGGPEAVALYVWQQAQLDWPKG